MGNYFNELRRKIIRTNNLQKSQNSFNFSEDHNDTFDQNTTSIQPFYLAFNKYSMLKYQKINLSLA